MGRAALRAPCVPHFGRGVPIPRRRTGAPGRGRVHGNALRRRGGLLHEVRDRSQHPLAKFLYPEYEDATKRRRIGTEAGLYVCCLSTLLWTPLSPVCQECAMAGKCREMTRERYPELYRLRVEHDKQGGRP